MDLDDLLRAQPKLHQDASGQPYSWQLGNNLLRFIDSHVGEGARTLEVGAGVSTVLFALKGATHLCIVPFEDEVTRIKAFCRDHHIPIDKLRFEIDRSDRCLPLLDIDGLDLVLIDGAHGFPIPFLDWYYTADRLKVGGLLLIDDANIWTGYVLKSFLMAEPEWKLEVDYPPRSVVFRKLQAGGCGKNEWAQPHVVQQTLDLMFSMYPDEVEGFRRFAPGGLFHQKEKKLTFRARRARSLARKAVSRVLPHPIKRGLKWLFRL
jgi:predicted O-methyltransferase YrrM